MLQGINKARIGKAVYTRDQLDKTETYKTMEEVDGEQIEVEKERVVQYWGAWTVQHYNSISLAKKANGRGSITFQSVSGLPK